MKLLEARNIFFSYGDRAVLRDVSVALAAGEVVALLGPNGAGKSTLLRVLLGQLSGRGEIAWEGRAVAAWSRRQLSRRVAYLPQSPGAEAEQRVAEVLATGRAPYWGAFGLESAEDLRFVGEVARELGLDELMDRPMAELSGGQRQRVFLGRCLVQQPGALLLDEPNTFLDLRHQVELGRRLKDLAEGRGMAVLMASHDLNLAAMVASRLILLKEGEVAAQGTPDEVLTPQIVSGVYGIEMRRVEPEGWKHPLIFPAEEDS
jgi:ABC-type cobalamin/Fe3+-siderophores transport system ATPase subunit